MDRAHGTVSWRELAAVALAFALICAWPFRDSLFTAERAVFGVDCATGQLPWSANLEHAPAGAERPRNPTLSDQAHGFYPFYRWVSESWRSGDPPLWNPLIYAGVPGLGNPQTGALDPQVLVLVGLEALFGRAAFDWGLTATSWLRLVAAAVGTWLLARCLGLGRPGAALAATTFAFSGFQLLWLGFSLGHVAPTLPWLLYFLERLRAERPARAAVGVAAMTALSIYAGHPETTFYAGVAAAAWAVTILRDDRRAGGLAFASLTAGTLLAAPLVLPFLEYLGASAAQLIREHRSEHTAVDLIALGALVVAAGFVSFVRRERRAGLEGRGAVVIASVALGAAGLWLALAARGSTASMALVLIPDLFGFPGDGVGYRGPGTLAEEASGWVPCVAAILAAAAVLRSEGPLARRGLVTVLGLVALLLALHAPGLVDVYRRIPSIGLGAPVRFAVVSALLLGLLAGESLESAPATVRRSAAAAFLALVALILLLPQPSYLADGVDRSAESDELVGFGDVPQGTIGPGPLPVTGWIDASVPFDALRLRVEATGTSGAPQAGGTRHFVPVEASAPEASGRRRFHTPSLSGTPLHDGAWRLTLEVLGAEAKVLGERRVALVERRAERVPGSWTFLLIGAGAALVCVGASGGAWASLIVLLALVQGLGFARRANPAVPRAEFFGESQTERVLARELGDGRYLGDEGVLPPSTGMVRGLRAVDGYDGMDVADFNVYRAFAVQAGMHPLLGWTPRGVQLDGVPFRLLGVTMLATRGPLAHPDWELIAGPSNAPQPAEVHLYRARDPLPRALVAGELRSADELATALAAGGDAWDPLEVAAWDGPGEIRAPRTEWSVEPVSSSNNEVRLAVELDGDGLLILNEQFFAGWEVRVDGDAAELGKANAIFQGVLLDAGRHDVVFRYRPGSLQRGLWLALVGMGALVGIAFFALRRR